MDRPVSQNTIRERVVALLGYYGVNYLCNPVPIRKTTRSGVFAFKVAMDGRAFVIDDDKPSRTNTIPWDAEMLETLVERLPEAVDSVRLESRRLDSILAVIENITDYGGLISAQMKDQG